MEKTTLAQELKSRQFDKYDEMSKAGHIGKLTKNEWADILYNLPDDQIIESYTVCSGCQSYFVDPNKIPLLIKKSKDAEDFLNNIDINRIHGC